MIVFPLKTYSVKLYSIGIETEYGGKFIKYNDFTVTFMFFYYEKIVKLYIVNGMEKKDFIPQIDSNVNLIASFENKEARRIRDFLNDKLKESKDIFYFPPLFFRYLYSFVSEKNYRYHFENLYDTFREKIKNGTDYSYV